jgi:hypothetical protein
MRIACRVILLSLLQIETGKPLDDNALTRETVFTAQQQDTHCKELMNAIQAGTEFDYLISEDVLLHKE